MPVTVRAMQAADWPAAAAVDAEGIATGDATFETEVPAWEHVLLERRSETAGT